MPGKLAYDPNYEFQTSGDYFEIKNGTKAWPDPYASATGGERIDDLWHAAVNGRGRYYSADNPNSLATSLTGALNSIESSKGSGTSASASNLRPVAGDNAIFIASYYSGSWDGDVKAQTVNPTTGIIDSTVLWNARVQVTGQSPSTRNLYFFDAASPSKLSAFNYLNLTSAGKNGSFDGMCPATGAGKLSQCLTLSATDKTLITGERLVNFLRGNGSFEASPSAVSPLFRYRYNEKEGYRNVLGDIVNAAPVFVKQPKFRYLDSGYSAFVNAGVDRKAVVYAGANDGMLHALDATTGVELWGYIPSMVLPKLHKLADTNYALEHDYFVDAAPTAGDVEDGNGNWRTILVGGLGNGGRGYYALDVTNPGSPKALWEYTETDLGATFGNPVITKIKDGGNGRWAVVFSSGYNNVNGGNGQGYLYVLDAVTGALIGKVATGVGGTTTPSNLGRINNWVDNETDNLTETVYGGDLLGNVWRFDIGDATSSNWRAVLLGKTESASGAVQSITVKPELTEIKAGGVKYRLVSVGTGRYLGSSDVGSTVVQSVYVFKDPLAATGLGVLRSTANMVRQTLSDFTTSTGVVARTLANPQAVDWSTDAGWFVDFSLTSGERVDIEMRQQLTRLNVATNAPDPNACSSGGAGGTSWLYYFDIVTGSYVTTSQDGMLLASKVDDTTTAGQEVIQLADGSLKTIVCSRDGECMTLDDPPAPASAVGLRRTSWRELIN
ncbi:MAG: PQQ-binding-like beta-propeller repeat protein [Methylibium sp.]|nr:PQQ-binding-like beta-propeller repeat protein [Methylibium sp.]